MISYTAFAVSQAAYNTFKRYGNAGYASSKTHIFLRRCGIGALPTGKQINKDILKQVCYAMMDVNSENIFWMELADD
jgi:hypothetical protein